MLFSSVLLLLLCIHEREFAQKYSTLIHSIISLYARLNGMGIYYKNKLWPKFLYQLGINILSGFLHRMNSIHVVYVLIK